MTVRQMIGSLLVFYGVTVQSTYCQTWYDLYTSADSLYASYTTTSFRLALEKAQTALQMAEAQFGATDTSVARVLELMKDIHESSPGSPITEGLSRKLMFTDLPESGANRPRDALACAERALSIREKILGPDHVEVARTLQHVAKLYYILGRGKEAIPLIERALSIYEKANATGQRGYASALYNRAFLYDNLGRHQTAEVMYRRALQRMRIVFPPGDPDFAYILTFFAFNYWSEGLCNEAEPLLIEALSNWEHYYGPESPRTAICMSNLSEHYWRLGNFAKDEELERRSFDIMRKTLSSDEPMLGRGYFGFGIYLLSRGKYAEAVDTLQRAMEIWHRLKEPASRTVWVLITIGECHLAMHSYALAESDFRRSIALEDSLAGYALEAVPSGTLGLATVYMRTARFRLADSLLSRILASREQRLGPDGLGLVEVLETYCEYYRLVGDMSKALSVSLRAVAARSKNFRMNARMMAENDALSFSSSLRQSLDSYLSAFVDAHVTDSALIRRTAEIILSNKGQTTEQAILRQRNLVFESDSATLALAEDYRYTRYQLSTLYVRGPGQDGPEAFRRAVDSLERAADRLESLLVRKSASFANTEPRQSVSIDGVASHLPVGTKVVEYLKFNYVSLVPDTSVAHYAAVVVDSKATVHVVDLGEAGKIDRIIERYQSHFAQIARLSRPLGAKEEMDYAEIASGLDSLVWRPLEPLLEEGTSIFIAPDGGLNLISFAGLMEGGRYLIERYPLHYLSAGRDILRASEQGKSGKGFVAFGDPDFDASVTERMSAQSQLALNAPVAYPYQLRNARSGCVLLKEMIAQRLFGTRTEVESIARLWRERNAGETVESFVGSEASEDLFKRESRGKRMIHLATHAYSVPPGCIAAGQGSSGQGENPLLQSGLLLAGANLHGEGAKEQGAEDGILTVLEVSGMDLSGTDRVVLSACETGLGKVEQGEGVYGLRRAFQVAGARTVVSSLWQVPDAETKEFMKALYSSRATTYPMLMQQVALQRIRDARLRGRPEHPFSWGAFVATGDWSLVH